jgi:hypothetical protein
MIAVVPQDPNSQKRSYNTNTFGLNQVGTDILNDQFWNSPFFGTTFTNEGFEGVIEAFSAGVSCGSKSVVRCRMSVADGQRSAVSCR